MTGKTISHYKILEKLGEGGMGVVYKAEDLRLKRIVAMKFLPRRLSVHGEERERFIQEAQAASALNHPNICVIHEIDEADGESFIVMEYMDGVTLREWIRRKAEQTEGYRKPGVKEAVNLAAQIAEGLEKAHEKGIIHRDVKSDNIMVTTDGRAKIMDFGLAKLKGVSKLTKTGSTVGTVAYMSPEQVEGIETDHRTDIFSFGVVVYEMLSGHLPFRAEHETAMMYEIINVEPQSLADQRRGIDSDLSRIVMKCLEKEREERYQSMREVAIDLRRYRRDSEGRRIERKSEAGEARAATPASSQERPEAPVTRRWKVGLSAIGVVLLIALGIYLFTSKTASIDSIAVLPFENVGADPNTEYLSDGITESLINTLSQLSNLSVMSSSSVFRYRGKEIDPQKAGKELGVKAVLRGRVIQRGDNLQISSELVDVSNNTHIWGEQYSRKLSDILAVQDEITKAISEKLSLKLGGEEQKKLTRHYTENAEAYQRYVQGRYYWYKRTEEGFRRAIGYFEHAIQIDPGYALAYSGLADAYSLLADWGFAAPNDAFPKAKEAAVKALEIDQTLAEAHTSLAYIQYEYDWDFPAAEREYKRAIELNPNYVLAHHWYAYFLSLSGRHDAAIAEIKQAEQLDPLSIPVVRSVGAILLFARRYDESIDQLRKSIEMDPAYPIAHFDLSSAYRQKGLYDLYVEEYLKGMRLNDAMPEDVASLRKAYEQSGVKAFYGGNLLIAERQRKDKYQRSSDIAQWYALLNDRDKAFEWLEKAYAERDPYIINLMTDPALDDVRPDPRFSPMLKKIGLEK